MGERPTSRELPARSTDRASAATHVGGIPRRPEGGIPPGGGRASPRSVDAVDRRRGLEVGEGWSPGRDGSGAARAVGAARRAREQCVFRRSRGDSGCVAAPVVAARTILDRRAPPFRSYATNSGTGEVRGAASSGIAAWLQPRARRARRPPGASSSKRLPEVEGRCRSGPCTPREGGGSGARDGVSHLAKLPPRCAVAV